MPNREFAGPIYTTRLNPVAPFDFAPALRFIGGFMPTHAEQIVDLDSLTLTKAFSVEGKPTAVQLRSIGTVDNPSLDVSIYGDSALSPDAIQLAIRRASHYLSLNDDLRPFYAIGEKDEAFVPILKSLYGYHQVKFPTPFESACWAILSQRNLMTVAYNMKTALSRAVGDTLVLDGITLHAFPDADAIAAADYDTVNKAIRNTRKAETLLGMARAFVSADEDWLLTAPYQEAVDWLKRIKGIGDWSANFILLRGLGRMEQIPVMENRFREVANRAYGESLLEAELQHVATRYGIYQGYWAHYLRVSG